VRLRGVATDYAVVLQRDGLPLSEAEAICFLARSAPSRPRQRCFSDLITAPFAGMTGVVRLCREPSKRVDRSRSIGGLDCRVKPGNDDNVLLCNRISSCADLTHASRKESALPASGVRNEIGYSPVAFVGIEGGAGGEDSSTGHVVDFQADAVGVFEQNVVVAGDP
jgi:hypothetical protein